MKKVILKTFALVVLFGCSNTVNENSNRSIDSADITNNNETIVNENSTIRDKNYYTSKGFQVFTKYNLAIKLPVKLADISSQDRSNHDFNYGGFENPKSKTDIAFYQIIIDDLPSSYSQLSEKEQKAMKIKILNEGFKGNKKAVTFLEQEAFVMDFVGSNGFPGKAIIFIKNAKTFGFNIMTKNKLDEKFNAMTNNIIFY